MVPKQPSNMFLFNWPHYDDRRDAELALKKKGKMLLKK
jgi:hypothetical protein